MNRTVLLLLLSWGSPLGAEPLVIELEDSRIRAGDLAAAIGAAPEPETDLGPAPAPGVRRRVSRAQLARWAERAGLAPADLPEEAVLLRKMRPWTEQEAAALLQSLLERETSAEIEVELAGFSTRQTPAGELDWRLLGSPRFSGRPVRVSLVWRDPGGRTGVETVTASVRMRIETLVARHDLAAGDEVQPGDFRLAAAPVADFQKSYLSVLKQDGIWVLRKPLKAGAALSDDLIEQRPEVERGAIVELTVEVGAVRLRAPARAEGAGSKGDLLPFRNLETNKRVLARVVGARSAEVASR